MTNDEAFKVVGVLVAGTNGWDEPKVLLWTRKLEALKSFECAINVANRVIDTHTTPGAPLWAPFHQAYLSEVRTTTPALPAGRSGPAISLAEFIREHASDAELNTLDRIARKRTDGRPAWVAALAPEGD